MIRRLAGRYLLGEQRGVGGTSRVYVATDERLGRQVAVKCLDASLAATADPAGRDRFLAEGRRAASFTHRHAVTVFDAGEDDGELFIVMELVQGLSLAEHLAESGPLAVDEAVRIATQVATALGAAHAIGIVHRDVKPANILLDESGDAKLADFGLAKRFDELEASLTAVGMVAGTPKYLAPEQTVVGPVTPAADVYALGVVLHEMLTGLAPFDAGSPTATAALRRAGPPPDIRGVRPDTPPALAALVARTLAPDPADRPPDAGVLADELRATSLRAAFDPPVPLAAAAVATTATPTVERTQIQPMPVPVEAPADRRRWSLIVSVLVALGFLGAVLALGAASGGGSPSSGAVPSIGAETTVVVDPASTEVAAPASVPVVTEVPLTTAVAPPVVVPELVPGFPVTDDLGVFLAQLAANPDLAGPAGPELVDGLTRVLDERSPKKLEEKAKELREWIADQAEEGTLDPVIAVALDDLLAALDRGGDDGDDD